MRVCVQVGVRAGERILQLGFGSGFKCAAAYWRALRDVRELPCGLGLLRLTCHPSFGSRFS